MTNARTFRFLSAAALLGALAQPAAAQTVQARVAYHIYELATPAGVAAVNARIEGAAKRACAGRTLAERMAAKSCAATLAGQMTDRVGPAVMARVARSGTELALKR